MEKESKDRDSLNNASRNPCNETTEETYHDCSEALSEKLEHANINDDDDNYGDPQEDQEQLKDDFVDEDGLKEEEAVLTTDQLQERFEHAKELKEKGNESFKNDNPVESINYYTRALLLCPLKEKEFRAILYGNRAAAKIKLGAKDLAIEDCSKSLEYKPEYVKSLVRRANLYEEMEKLDEALEDHKKILEIDPSNKDSKCATMRLPPMIHERNEKLKAEMMGKLKDLGNMVLRPFGLSTNNFQLQQTESGGYSINFKQ